MPIHALEDQKRGTKLGEIRVGTFLKKENRAISLLNFRLTTKREGLARKIADLFGGTPAPVTLQNGVQTIEVMTETNELPVVVPPRDAIISQFRELWGGKVCQRKCDSVTELLTKTPCNLHCPVDEDERREAAQNGTACKDVTRLSLMLPDVALGVWRFATTSVNAALEFSDSTDILGAARKQNLWLEATFRNDERIEPKKINGKIVTRKFVVCSLIPDRSPREIASGQIASGFMGSLPPLSTLALGSGAVSPVDKQSADAGLALDVQSDELASPGQRSAIRARLALLSPVNKSTFDRWIANEKKAGGIHAFAQLLSSEVELVMAKLDVLDPENAPPEWDDDDIAVDAEIVEDGSVA